MNKPRTLSDVLADYASADKLSKQDLEAVSQNTRAGFANRIRAAKDALPKLRIEYLTRILKNSAAFFVEGGDKLRVAEFKKHAVANGAFVVDAAAIFETLADKIQRSLGVTRQFSITQTGLLDQELRELVKATGYDEAPKHVAIRDLRVVPTRERLVDYIRELVVSSNGGTPSRVAAQAALLDQTLKAKFTDPRLIVVVENTSSLDRAALAGLFSKVIPIDLDDVDGEVDERFVKEFVVASIQGRKPNDAPKTQSQSLSPAAPQAQQTQTQSPTQNQE
jgi:hypothetical protein